MKLAIIGLLAFGGMACLAPSANAQHGTRPARLGFLAYSTVIGVGPLSLVKVLHELGYDEGKNLTIDYRSADAKEREPA